MTLKKSWTPILATEFIDEKLNAAASKYAVTQTPQLVSFREWCSNWDWAKRSDVYTHQMHSYPAKLLPYIPIIFLTSSLSASDDSVLDSFAGTSTVGLECMVHNFNPRNFYGVEINPLARLIAKVKTTPLSIEQLTTLANRLQRSIERTTISVIPEFTNRDLWFRGSAQRDLARIRHCIEELDASPDERDFFRVCFSAIIRDMSRADPDVAPPVLLRAEKFPKDRQQDIRSKIARKQRANAIRLFFLSVTENIERMRDLVMKIGDEPRTRCEIIWDDARDIKRGLYVESGRIDKTNPQNIDGSIGLVITSPPYMAAQKYVRTTKLELSWLGLARESEIRQLDRDTIGVEKVPITEVRDLIPTANPTADTLLIRVFKRKPDRAAVASRYYREMRHALRAIHRVLKDNATLILVVGNNTIDGRSIPNHKILAEIASENKQFRVTTILRDPIRSRGMITKRHDTAGLIDDEYVLVLHKQNIRTTTNDSTGG